MDYSFARRGGPGSTATPHTARPRPTRPGPQAPAEEIEIRVTEIRPLVEFRADGILRENWMRNHTDPGNKTKPHKLDLKELTKAENYKDKWRVEADRHTVVPDYFKKDSQKLGLPQGRTDYWQLRIQRKALRKVYDEDKKLLRNFELNMVAKGVIIAQEVEKADDTRHWSDIVLAQYRVEHKVNTLRCVYIQNLCNKDTLYCLMPLYSEKYQILHDKHIINKIPRDEQTVWEWGTYEFQCLLGTVFGKGVTAIVLSAFPEGGYRIGRIVTWKHSLMQMRFDIMSTEEFETEQRKAAERKAAEQKAAEKKAAERQRGGDGAMDVDLPSGEAPGPDDPMDID
ncbi:hypothetical protein N7475_009398 [Penicillium sp. IBT 31633x]|nr:hypothetical protein N7475_009398 [Penicillium sp. IBT 31633x]